MRGGAIVVAFRSSGRPCWESNSDTRFSRPIWEIVVLLLSTLRRSDTMPIDFRLSYAELGNGRDIT